MGGFSYVQIKHLSQTTFRAKHMMVTRMVRGDFLMYRSNIWAKRPLKQNTWRWRKWCEKISLCTDRTSEPNDLQSKTHDGDESGVRRFPYVQIKHLSQTTFRAKHMMVTRMVWEDFLTYRPNIWAKRPSEQNTWWWREWCEKISLCTDRTSEPNDLQSKTDDGDKSGVRWFPYVQIKHLS